jgi:hypothetical protein
MIRLKPIDFLRNFDRQSGFFALSFLKQQGSHGYGGHEDDQISLQDSAAWS